MCYVNSSTPTSSALDEDMIPQLSLYLDIHRFYWNYPIWTCSDTKREGDETKQRIWSTSTGLIRVDSLLIFWDRPLSLTPFPPNSSQNISIFIHWSLDMSNSYTHRSTKQKSRIQNLHLAIHENLQRAQSLWLQSVHQKSNINTGMAFEVRTLDVHSILWASNPIPYRMLQCMLFFTMLDQRPMTRLPSRPNCSLKTPDSGQFVPHLPMLFEETHSHAKW
jgi:hypothetical protein